MDRDELMRIVEGVGDAKRGRQLFRLSHSPARDSDDLEPVEEAQDGKVISLSPPTSRGDQTMTNSLATDSNATISRSKSQSCSS